MAESIGANYDDTEIRRLRDRQHELASHLQDNRLMTAEHSLRIGALESQMKEVHTDMATKEQLETAAMKMTLKLDNLRDTLDPIKRGVYWLVALICGSVVIALLSLVVKK